MDWIDRLALPALRMLPAETAHGVTVAALKSGLVPRSPTPADPRLGQRVAGLDFANPVGLAAGFDKNAEVPDAMLAQGFGFVEVGSVTPRRQAGNPRPRLFRLTKDAAVINRMGFNNDGLDAALGRLAQRDRNGIVGVNLGANADSPDRIADYVTGLQRLGPHADYVTVNVSSPNTAGLRGLQEKDSLQTLIDGLLSTRRSAEMEVPIFLKIAPDLDATALADIAAVVTDRRLDGVVVSNTTIERPVNLTDPQRKQAGGLSGRPLFAPSTRVLAHLYRLTAGAVPLVGVGGIASGADAFAKIQAGASLVQLYTALIFHGPGLVRRINKELVLLLERQGFAALSEAVGSAAGDYAPVGD